MAIYKVTQMCVISVAETTLVDPRSDLDYRVGRDKGGFSQAPGLTPLEADIEVNTKFASKVFIRFFRVHSWPRYHGLHMSVPVRRADGVIKSTRP
jgi:hypothetical protein